MSDDKEQSCVAWLIKKAKGERDASICESKAWLLTGISMYPNSFLLKFELYNLAKLQKFTEEAAHQLAQIYKVQSFHTLPELRQEVRSLVSCVQADNLSPQARLHADIFSLLAEDVQCSILKNVSEDTPDVISRASFLLLLMRRFPHLARENAFKLAEELSNAELAENPSTPNNIYRKFFAVEALPHLLTENLSLEKKVLLGWLDRCMHFFLVAALGGTDGSLSPPKGGTTVSPPKGGTTASPKISRPFDNLADLILKAGKHVKWSISPAHFLTTESLSQYSQSLKQRLTKEHSKSMRKEFVYVSTFLLFKLIFSYLNHKHAKKEDCVLAQTGFVTKLAQSSPKKMRKVTLDGQPVLKASKSVSLGDAVLQDFKMACSTWAMIHSDSSIVKGFNDLLQRLHYQNWCEAVEAFHYDRMLYQQEYNEILLQLGRKVVLSKQQLIQKACCKYATGEKREACEVLFDIISDQAHAFSNPQVHPRLSSSSDYSSSTSIEFAFLSLEKDLSLCFTLIIQALSEKLLKTKDCELIGNLVVLTQMAWPKYRNLFHETLSRIKELKNFAYTGFFDYIVNIEVLEEFAFLHSLEDGVKLDILPSVQQITRQRAVTRGVEKGVQEDFRQAFEKQASKANQSIELVISDFIRQRKDAIISSI